MDITIDVDNYKLNVRAAGVIIHNEKLLVHKIEFINEEDKKIEYTMKNVEGKDYLQYEWLELDRIDEYPLEPKAVKDILKENKFPIHKINNDLK